MQCQGDKFTAGSEAADRDFKDLLFFKNPFRILANRDPVPATQTWLHEKKLCPGCGTASRTSRPLKLRSEFCCLWPCRRLSPFLFLLNVTRTQVTCKPRACFYPFCPASYTATSVVQPASQVFNCVFTASHYLHFAVVHLKRMKKI